MRLSEQGQKWNIYPYESEIKINKAPNCLKDNH